jgi:hypothetical protein
MLNVQFQVILQIVTDAGEMMDQRYVDRLQHGRVPDTAEHQQLRAIYGAAAKDDVTFAIKTSSKIRPQIGHFRKVLSFDADRPIFIHDYFRDHGVTFDE